MENTEVTKENVDEVFKQLVEAMTGFLMFVYKKSGVRRAENAVELVSFCSNEDKIKSMFLGEYITPTEDNPQGEILLHVDSILDLAEFLGVDFYSLLMKTFLCQVHCLINWESKNKFNFEKAEKFAEKAMKKLSRQGIQYDYRAKVFVNPADNLNMMARVKWISKWTGKTIEECAEAYTIS